jgi:multidrug efflux pump
MKISDLCIRRPVFATVLSLAIMLVGLVSYTRLPVREYPKIDEPVVTVDTTYRGASAEIVESQISKPLEDSLAGIEGVDVITSISRQENSQISVRFKLERNPDSAAADVRDRVSRVRNKLPTAIDEPVIAKVEADANPIIWIAFSSDQHSALEVTDVANRIVKPRLQTLPGAADVRVFGERKFAMRIWLDRDRLAAYNLTRAGCRGRAAAAERRGAGGAHRKREPRVLGGRAHRSDGAGAVRRNHRQAGADARGSYPVRIADLGRVEIGAASERSSVRFKGRPAVALGVIKQATANPLELSRALRAEVPKVISRTAAGNDGQHRLRLVGVHRPLDRRRLQDHRRGDAAGPADHLLLPAQLPGDADSAGDHPGVADRRLRPDAGARLHHQHADPAGAGAGDRPRGRRCDRRPREHLPPHRGRACRAVRRPSRGPRRSASRSSR